jgi:hypothetical protein
MKRPFINSVLWYRLTRVLDVVTWMPKGVEFNWNGFTLPLEKLEFWRNLCNHFKAELHQRSRYIARTRSTFSFKLKLSSISFEPQRRGLNDREGLMTQ